MSQNYNKQKLSIIIILLVFVISTILGLFGYFRSDDYLEKQMIKAIDNRNINQFIELCPKYTNGQSVTKSQVKLYFQSIDKNTTQSEIQKQLDNNSRFIIKNQDKTFTKKNYLVKAKYIKFNNLGKDTSVGVSDSKKSKNITEGKHKVGPFIPGDYKIWLNYDNEILGKDSKKQSINLLDNSYENNDKLINLYEDSKTLQKTVLKSIMQFMISYNEYLNDGLNIHKVNPATDSTKRLLETSLKQVLKISEYYENEFSKITMRPDTFKISEFNGDYKVTCDVLLDRKQILKVKLDDGESEKNKTIHVDEGNARFELTYNNKEKVWEVSNFNFNVYQQDEDYFKDGISIKLKTPSIGKWDSSKDNEFI